MTQLYTLEHMNEIILQANECTFQLSSQVLDKLENLNKIIEPIILDNRDNTHHQKRTHNSVHHNNDSYANSKQQSNKTIFSSTSFPSNNHYERNNGNSKARTRTGQNTKNGFTQNTSKSRQTRSSANSSLSSTIDAQWERVPEFKPTKIEMQSEGPMKILQDIRVSLNKISNTNYENQKDSIVNHMKDVMELDSDSIPKIAQFIFDVASTNRFYSETYSVLYKELMEIHPVFQDTLNTFLQNYISGVKNITPVDADEDYDKFCDYNKKNDMRRATTVFIVNLMKQSVVPRLRVLNVIMSLQDIIVQKVEEVNATQVVEEMTELLFLFLQESNGEFSDVKVEWTWKFKCIPMIEIFAKYKKTDKPSISSRAIFKYMDMMTLIEKCKKS